MMLRPPRFTRTVTLVPYTPLVRSLGVEPLAIVRTKEDLFGDLGLAKDNGYSDAQWLDALASHPKLMERPIVIYNGRAAIGRPPEHVLSLLDLCARAARKSVVWGKTVLTRVNLRGRRTI